ncbi:MAG: hypothetical protein IPL25_10615 [Saprospiraceae bacterium]|nr:hypothetical protein [Candidatus Vicinibacter affinis]
MKTKLILLMVVGISIFSCSDKVADKSKLEDESVVKEEHSSHNDLQTIELNNGEKWKVDDHMLVHIRNMEKDVQMFSTSVPKNYNLLAEKLQNNIDLLTSHCTMEGKAHDELHKWLLPYIDMVAELVDTKDETTAMKQFENIKTSFATFNQFFQ